MDSAEFVSDERTPADRESRPTSPVSLHQVGWRWRLMLVLYLLWLALCNAAIVPLTVFFRPSERGAVFVFLAMGGFSAQLGVLAAWLVWGCGGYWFRIAIGWGIAALFLSLWAAGFIVGYRLVGRVIDYEELFVALAFPLLSLSMAAPLWFLKVVFGLRIVRSDAGPDRPLAIGDLLGAMSVTAVALTLARVGKGYIESASDAEYWGVIALGSGISAAVSLLLLPLCAFVATGIRSDWKSLFAASLMVVVLGLALAATAYLSMGMPPMGMFGLFGIFLAASSCTANLVFPFWLARAAAYRLVLGKSSAGDSR